MIDFLRRKSDFWKYFLFYGQFVIVLIGSYLVFQELRSSWFVIYILLDYSTVGVSTKKN